MKKVRPWAGLVAVAAMVLAGCGSGSGKSASAATSPTATPATAAATTTTAAPATTTTTAPPPSTTAPPAVVDAVALPPLDPGEVLAQGAKGDKVLALQQRLVALHFDPGPLDGSFGLKTTQAIWAFQHLSGIDATGKVDEQVWELLTVATDPAPIRPDGGPDRVEISIDQQVLRVYQGGQLVLLTHISTGSGRHYCDNGSCGTATTPKGDFAFTHRISGWHKAPLGELYNPVYFHNGYAVHGSTSVPNGPASHGCVRVPMHIAEYFPSLVTNGEPVFVV